MITWDQAIGEPGLWLGWIEGQDTRFDEPAFIVKEVPEGGAWAGW